MACAAAALAGIGLANAAMIPLAEHPRPDFQRADWLNLNGPWQLRFDKENAGEAEQWFSGKAEFPETITVPFPWGSKLSGVENKADIAWYGRDLQVPATWRGRRVFLVVGACDWETSGWLDGQLVGRNRGGYTPFAFELTALVKWDQQQRLVLRVDDTPHPFKLEGKQGYGPAKGIWQTVYLEARPQTFLETLHFEPDIDRGVVTVKAGLNEPALAELALRLQFKTGGVPPAVQPLAKGAIQLKFDLAIPQARWWSPDDPFLYEVDVLLSGGGNEDRVAAYFGMRKISVVKLPGAGFPYIALNNQPFYLQMTLDQSYHPDGFYTYPSDEFMRDEILRSRRLGLNANRLHVKIDVPRKLYWADRLGLLIMADVPNSWGEPTGEMRRELETALRGMLQRDFNHPAIFAWVLFNETWGLVTKQGDQRLYLPETQQWVESVYRLAKSLDPTRLVEDNSPCNHDHVLTDINSWHAYLPGYAWGKHLDQVTRDTHPGAKWNYIGGRTQAGQPLLNSECGNVWGYEGSTGDVDWSWDYHLMINEFRRHPQVCGWLYTEHHDVINEWNGYYRYDRSDKLSGLDELVPGMSLRDLHAPFYLSAGSDLCREAKPNQSLQVPLYASFMTDRAPDRRLIVRSELYGWDTFGHRRSFYRGATEMPFAPWMSAELPQLKLNLPPIPALCILQIALETPGGVVLHRNFTTFLVADGPAPRDEVVKTDEHQVRVVRFAPKTFRDARWSLKQWNVLDGLKVNGAGHGYFEYRLPWPAGLSPSKVSGATFLMEASAKQLFGKDREGAAKQEGDFMRGRGTHDPSMNPNAYPMTDTVCFPSAVRVRVSGYSCGVFELPDDPADHRGILSWLAQKHDRRLREAGSYGYLVSACFPEAALHAAAAAKEIVVRLEVDEALPGGLAIYGERFGRYPLDPTLVFSLKK
jgi:hypothetical protein